MPLGEGCRASKLVFLTTDEVPFLVEVVEVVGDVSVDGTVKLTRI